MLSASRTSFTPPSFNPSFVNPQKREQFALLPFSTVEALAGCSRAETSVFLALSLHADAQTGHCWPGRARLAEITRLNESRISKATSGLERKGLIRKELIAGCRVEYYLLPQGPRPVPVPVPVPEPVPTPDRNGTPPLTETAPITDQRTDQKEQREATPEPVVAAPAPEVVLSQASLRTPKTEAPDCIPEAWIDQAHLLRPDLSIETIRASAEVFLDHNRSKGILLVDWLPAWRNWIRREKAPKTAPQARHATQPVNRYAHLDLPKQPVSAAVQAALEVGEQRRLQMMAAMGIDPVTGLPMDRPPAPTSTLPDGDPLPQGRVESDREYEIRFEQHRQYQLRKLQEMMEARSAKAGGGGRK